MDLLQRCPGIGGRDEELNRTSGDDYRMERLDRIDIGERPGSDGRIDTGSRGGLFEKLSHVGRRLGAANQVSARRERYENAPVSRGGFEDHAGCAGEQLGIELDVAE